MRATPLLLLFFLSGASGLIYEIVWTRQLTLVLGNTVFAASTVLCAFMAGLGLGALCIARIVDKHPSPLRLYALIEGGIGIYALLTPLLFGLLVPVTEVVYSRVAQHFLVLNLVRIGFCFVVLIIPTALMGATLPTISRVVEPGVQEVGRKVGSLYGANTLGAASGCFAATFVLQRFVGLRLSLATGAAMNIAICLGILLYLKFSSSAPRLEPSRLESDPARGGVSPGRPFLVAFFIMGFAALAYEVLWVRTLILVFGATSYSFGVMLSVFLAAQALGSLLSARIADRVTDRLLWLGIIEIGVFATVILTGFVLPHLPAMIHDVSVASGRSWDAFLRTKLLLSSLIIGPPALLMGMTFPLGIKYFNRDLGVMGRDVGMLYAANTFGAIAGALSGGFILIALMGLRTSLIINSWLSLCLGIALLVLPGGRNARRLAVTVPVFLCAIIGTALSPRWEVTQFVNPVFYRKGPGGSVSTGSDTVLFHRETSAATITVQQREHGSPAARAVGTTAPGQKRKDIRILFIDGKIVASNNKPDLRNQYLLGHLPAIIHPDPQRGLVVGLGTGVTLGALNSHGLKQTDCVDLNPYVRQAAAYFESENENVLSHPSVNLIIEDARNYLLVTSEMYDIITSDPIHPFVAGATNLYTKEYYRLCKRRLSSGGVMCQWLPLYQMSVEDAKAIVNTFSTVFENTTLWAHRGDSVIIGINGGRQIDLSIIRERFDFEACREHLIRVDIPSHLALLSLLMITPDQVSDFCAGSSVISDDMPVLEYTTPHCMYLVNATITDNLRAIGRHRSATLESLMRIALDCGWDASERSALEWHYRAGNAMLAKWIGE